MPRAVPWIHCPFTCASLMLQGEIFGEVGLVYSILRTATVLAERACEIYVLARHDIGRIMSTNHEFGPLLQVRCAPNACFLFAHAFAQLLWVFMWRESRSSYGHRSLLTDIRRTRH